MKRETFWKNFVVGTELDIAGSFIYNGIKKLDAIENYSNTVDIFEILYDLSVGLERLLKIGVVLIEHSEEIDLDEFEISLITHDTMGLAKRVDKHFNLKLSKIHNEFLSLLSKFYKTYRYDRFSLSSEEGFNAERSDFLRYLEKYLNIKIDDCNGFYPVQNTDREKKFIGKVVKHISKNVYELIQNRSHELGIFTYEIRSDSKASKVFWDDELNFIDERQIKKELLLFLMHPQTNGKHIELVRSLSPLNLDSGLTAEFIKGVLDDNYLSEVEGEVEQQYFDFEGDLTPRFEMLRVIDDYHVTCYDEEE